MAGTQSIRWLAAMVLVGVVGFAGFRAGELAVVVKLAPGQAERTTADPIRFDVVFSEPVVGFNSSDVSLGRSTALGDLRAEVSGSGSVYQVTVSGMAGPGTVAAVVPAGSASDAGGQRNTTSTSKASVLFEAPASGSLQPVLADLL